MNWLQDLNLIINFDQLFILLNILRLLGVIWEGFGNSRGVHSSVIRVLAFYKKAYDIYYMCNNNGCEFHFFRCFDHFVLFHSCYMLFVSCVIDWRMIPDAFKRDLSKFEAFKIMSLTCAKILCFEREKVIWIVTLDLKCRLWVRSIVSLSFEPLFYILTPFIETSQNKPKGGLGR